MVEWTPVPLAFEPWREGTSDVFSLPGQPIRAPLPSRAAVRSPRQHHFEERVRAIAWLLGTNRVPVYLDFQGERRQLDRGCIGHAVANGVLLPPEADQDGIVSFVELAGEDQPAGERFVAAERPPASFAYQPIHDFWEELRKIGPASVDAFHKHMIDLGWRRPRGGDLTREVTRTDLVSMVKHGFARKE